MSLRRRRSINKLTAVLAVATSLAACNGGTQTTPKGPDDLVTTDEGPGGATIAGAAGEERSYDTSPVNERGALVLHARWSNPQATIDRLAQMAQIPSGLVENNREMVIREMLRDAVGDDVDAGAFAAVVDATAPIDFAVVADVGRAGPMPEPMIGFSIGLRSLSEARAAAKGRPQELSAGVFRIGPERDWGDGCAIAASSGRTPARLVCVDSFRYLEALAPYMARNLPTLPEQSSDIHVELKLRDLFDKYGRQWTSQLRGLPILADQFKLGIRKFDDAVLDAATGLSKEGEALLKDADKVVLDAKLDGVAGGKLAITAHFTGSRSWIAQTLTADAAKASAAPGIFWRAPASSSTASYGRTGDPARWDSILQTGRALLEGFMEQEKLGTGGDRAALAKLLRSPFPKDKPTVFARGSFDRSGKTGLDALSESFGWMLWGVDDSGADMKRWLREAVSWYNRPTVKSAMKKELRHDADSLPTIKTVPAPPGLGGGLAIELSMELPDDAMSAPAVPGRRSSKPAKTQQLKGYLLTMSEGGRMWMAVGADKDKLTKLLTEVKAGNDTLTKRSGLDRLKRESHVAATVTNAEGLLASAMPGLYFYLMQPMGGGPDPFEEMKRALQQMPNKGQSPIFMFYDAKAGARPEVGFTVEVPGGTLRDLGSLVNKYMTPRRP